VQDDMTQYRLMRTGYLGATKTTEINWNLGNMNNEQREAWQTEKIMREMVSFGQIKLVSLKIGVTLWPGGNGQMSRVTCCCHIINICSVQTMALCMKWK
jgi:hypothetical protein